MSRRELGWLEDPLEEPPMIFLPIQSHAWFYCYLYLCFTIAAGAVVGRIQRIT